MKVWCFYNTNEFIFPQPPPNFHPFSQCHDKKIYDVVVQFEIKMYATTSECVSNLGINFNREGYCLIVLYYFSLNGVSKKRHFLVLLFQNSRVSARIQLVLDYYR